MHARAESQPIHPNASDALKEWMIGRSPTLGPQELSSQNSIRPSLTFFTYKTKPENG